MPQVGALAFNEPYFCKTADEVRMLALDVHERRKAKPVVLLLPKPKAAVSELITRPACEAAVRRMWMSTADRILDEVAQRHGFNPQELKFRRRLQPLVRARHEAMYWMYVKTPLSLPQIGRKFDGMDHTSVLHAVRAHARRNGLEVLKGHRRQYSR